METYWVSLGFDSYQCFANLDQPGNFGRVVEVIRSENLFAISKNMIS